MLQNFEAHCQTLQAFVTALQDKGKHVDHVVRSRPQIQKKANEIITTAKRFFASGENDYINYLRNINDAYSIQLKYLEAIRNYNQSILSIKYLTGTL